MNMTYEMFLEELKNELEKELDKTIKISKLLKINHTVDMIGLEEKSGKKLRADQLYDYYQDAGWNRLIANVKKALEETEIPQIPDDFQKETEKFSIFEHPEKIQMRIVNQEKNEELLKTCVHRNLEDLAIIYYYLVDNTRDYTVSFLITHEHLDGKTEDDLFKTASKHKKVVVRPMGAFMTALTGDEMFSAEENAVELLIVTNPEMVFGAANGFQIDVLEDICKKYHKEKLTILPSSVHEALIYLGNDVDVDDATTMVREVNATNVSEKEFLSDNVYTYQDGNISKAN